MIREAGEDDLALVVALRERLDPFVATTVEDTRVFLSLTEAYLQLVDDDVGFGFVGRWPGEREANLDVGVLPDARRQGRGAALYDRLLAFVRERRWPAVLAAATDDEGRAWLARRGFAEFDRQERVFLELGAVRTGTCDNSSYRFQITDLAARPELAPRLLEIAREALEDVPGELAAEGMPPLGTWLAQFDAPSRREDFVVIALDGDDAVGWAKLNVYPRVGYHDLTAVARSHRRRGVARALKLELIGRATALGLERLLTNSNVDNVAMRTLNAELGYRPAPARVFMRRSV